MRSGDRTAMGGDRSGGTGSDRTGAEDGDVAGEPGDRTGTARADEGGAGAGGSAVGGSRPGTGIGKGSRAGVADSGRARIPLDGTGRSGPLPWARVPLTLGALTIGAMAAFGGVGLGVLREMDDWAPFPTPTPGAIDTELPEEDGPSNAPPASEPEPPRISVDSQSLDAEKDAVEAAGSSEGRGAEGSDGSGARRLPESGRADGNPRLKLTPEKEASRPSNPGEGGRVPENGRPCDRTGHPVRGRHCGDREGNPGRGHDGSPGGSGLWVEASEDELRLELKEERTRLFVELEVEYPAAPPMAEAPPFMEPEADEAPEASPSREMLDESEVSGAPGTLEEADGTDVSDEAAPTPERERAGAPGEPEPVAVPDAPRHQQTPDESARADGPAGPEPSEERGPVAESAPGTDPGAVSGADPGSPEPFPEGEPPESVEEPEEPGFAEGTDNPATSEDSEEEGGAPAEDGVPSNEDDGGAPNEGVSEAP
ncbi:hypothetical protein [Salininema proteolyticum]|uniref:Uncharacterized protein n=1 Tax=Salininema proteolyticum TaxID=1607685 RepID=A0ABV8TUF0_9ACTN